MDILEQIKNYNNAGYDWKSALQSTEQDKSYHGEGDVWTHTMLVVEQLLGDGDFKALDKKEQKLLLLGAALHDIAKPVCTKIEDGKIISPNHAVKGETTARTLIYKYAFMQELFGKINFSEREQVCSLVRYHGLPLLFLEKAEIEAPVFKASLEIKPEYLYLLAKADINGRVSENNHLNLEKIELFKEFCMENGCFANAKAFLNEGSRYMYFKRSESYLNYSSYVKDKFWVFLMSGIPAAGKDTYISNHLKEYPVISLDGIRLEMGVDPAKNQGAVVQEAKSRAKKLLAKKESFVWNATNTTEKMRKPLIDLFTDYNAMVEMIYVEAPVTELLERNSLRAKPVPQNIIDKLTLHRTFEKTIVNLHSIGRQGWRFDVALHES